MQLEVVQYVMETEVDTPLFLNVALYAEKPGSKSKIPFTKCDDVEFAVELSDENFLYNSCKLNSI